jgi:hypothetical protein
VQFGGGIFDLNAVNDFASLMGNPTAFNFTTQGILITAYFRVKSYSNNTW